MPPGFNQPARAAERIAALDLVSNGRVEWGTGEASTLLELGGYGVSIPDKHDAWLEAVEQCANMLAMEPSCRVSTVPSGAGDFHSSNSRMLPGHQARLAS